MAKPLRVANCSGFYGDRLSAAKEMVEGGPIDVLTGDWLAELTMLILARTQAKHSGAGYAKSFVTQMEEVMGSCLDQGIKVVSNAGGLDPDHCAEAIGEVAAKLGLSPTIAYVNGDNLLPRLGELQGFGVDFAHLDTGEPAGDLNRFLTANAYLGCFGIVEALRLGADIVVTEQLRDLRPLVGDEHRHPRLDHRRGVVYAKLAQCCKQRRNRVRRLPLDRHRAIVTFEPGAVNARAVSPAAPSA